MAAVKCPQGIMQIAEGLPTYKRPAKFDFSGKQAVAPNLTFLSILINYQKGQRLTSSSCASESSPCCNTRKGDLSTISSAAPFPSTGITRT
jgi:hypothetical protein